MIAHESNRVGLLNFSPTKLDGDKYSPGHSLPCHHVPESLLGEGTLLVSVQGQKFLGIPGVARRVGDTVPIPSHMLPRWTE